MPDRELTKQMEQAIISMLSSIHKEEDVQQVMNAGITEACFAGALHYWEALQYIIGRIKKGKKISKSYLKRHHGVTLIAGDDAKLYAKEVVFGTALAQVDDITADVQDELLEPSDPTVFYEAVRKARNLLRDIAAPAVNGQRDMSTQSVTYTTPGSLVMPPPQEWLVKGFLPAKWSTFLYGRGGSAKSGLAVMIAVCVATGVPFLDVPAVRGTVLYLDWEADEETFRATLNRVAASLGVDISQGLTNIRFKRLYGPLNEHIDDIIEEVEDENVSLVIMDSFGFSMSGKDTSAQQDVTAQMARLATIPAAKLIIDHIGKQGRGEDGPFGSVYKHAASRWMWWLQAVNGEDERCPNGEHKPGVFVRMANTKHNIAAKQKDIFLHLTWDDKFASSTLNVKKVTRDEVPESLAGTIKETGEAELSPTQQEFLDHVREHYAETHQAISKEAMIAALRITAKPVAAEALSLHKMGLIKYVRLPKNARMGGSPRGYIEVNQPHDIQTDRENELLGQGD
ncbi:hypothetical protein LCGC14_1978060 [marine sediment metagenome]|uniref:Uncharacterized protein n=1 Tax=marine sediment metagenome TaxID=412755 RepID=A0A0F9FA11_9ZZZZ